MASALLREPGVICVLWRMLAIWVASGLLMGCPTVWGQQKRDEKNPNGIWEVLRGCRIAKDAASDGDSFHVIHEGRQFIFRLYFVDAPETDLELRDRVDDQGNYFGISAEHIPRAGKMAADFTRQRLSSREFTVVTRWENALGRSKLVRFYCIVFLDGRNLAEELVTHGLARIYGARADWPDPEQSKAFSAKLQSAERTAREQRRGLWDQRLFATDVPTRSQADGSRRGTGKRSVAARVAINSARAADLEALPGIGPKLAERIIAHRPYRTIDDLERVPGIGKKTIDRLRPRVRIDSVR